MEVWIVDQEDRHFTMEVHAFEIVPPAFRGIDTVADEDERRMSDCGGIFGLKRRKIDVRGVGKFADRTRMFKYDLRGRAELRVKQGHGLGPAAILSRWLKANRLQSADEIADGSFFADSTRRSPLKLVGG